MNRIHLCVNFPPMGVARNDLSHHRSCCRKCLTCSSIQPSNMFRKDRSITNKITRIFQINFEAWRILWLLEFLIHIRLYSRWSWRKYSSILGNEKIKRNFYLFYFFTSTVKLQIVCSFLAWDLFDSIYIKFHLRKWIKINI